MERKGELISGVEDTLRVLAVCTVSPARGLASVASVARKTPGQSHDRPISSP